MTKSKEEEESSEVLYPSEKNPKIDYADYIKANSSKEGSLIQFGQSHPDRNEITVVSELFLSKSVCKALRDTLNKLIEQMESTK